MDKKGSFSRKTRCDQLSVERGAKVVLARKKEREIKTETVGAAAAATSARVITSGRKNSCHLIIVATASGAEKGNRIGLLSAVEL